VELLIMKTKNIALSAVLFTTACVHDISQFDRVEIEQARDLDILFVYDTSATRGTYDVMAQQIDDLMVLNTIDGQLPNLHVGVVTTDLGTSSAEGAGTTTIGRCANDGDGAKLVTFGRDLGTGNFLIDERGAGGARTKNYASATLAAELALLTNPSLADAPLGCERPQPFEAMRRALDPATNPNFIRPNAMLAVIFLTSGDDCSAAVAGSFSCVAEGVICEGNPAQPGTATNCQPREATGGTVDVSAYKAFLESYKQYRGDLVVGAVTGDGTTLVTNDDRTIATGCTGAGGSAQPAIRVNALVAQMGGASVNTCTQDNAYETLVAPILRQHERSCLQNLEESTLRDCTVIETLADGTTATLERCPEGGADVAACWYTYEADPVACPDAAHLAVGVDRGTSTVPVGSSIEATCYLK